jgi:hypothetical protein
MLHKNILSAIGNTPPIKINRLFQHDSVEIYGKLESSNPGGSVKERIALSMIEAGEASGELTSDKIILEAIHNRVHFCRPRGPRGMIAFLPVCQYTVLVLG